MALRLLDDYLARELSDESERRVAGHLAGCADCARERDFRSALRTTLRTEWSAQPVPEGLEGRVLERVLPQPGVWRRFWRPLAVAAAAVAIVMIVWIAPNWLQPPVEAIDHHTEAIEDHLRCRYRAPVSREAETMVDKVAEKIKYVLESDPNLASFQLLNAHLCTAGGVDFVHFMFLHEGRGFSVVMEARQKGVSAWSSRAEEVMLGDMPVGIQKSGEAAVLSFQTPYHLVYLVTSPEDSTPIQALAKNLFPKIGEILFDSPRLR